MKFARHVGRFCNNLDYYSVLDSVDAVVDTDQAHGNVTVKFWLRGLRTGPLQMSWQPISRDLFDMGAMIYIADELAERDKVWDRHLHFNVPVMDINVWSSNEKKLSDLLYFLTGDQYAFEWMESRNLPHYGQHRVKLPFGRHSAVCMFSGGLDSLMGAIRLLENGESVLLVGHITDSVASAAQVDLYKSLHARFGNRVELIQCSLGRSTRRNPNFALPEKKEDSHRSRSFLFLTLGIAVARGARIDRLFLAENGLIALNPPLGTSRVGSLSTRTAHPRFLDGFLSLVNSLGAFYGNIVNPFLYLSKTDILRGLEEWQKPLLMRSVSCAHVATTVRWAGKRGVLHCGYCVPCIYRRVAMMTANVDRPDDYCEDVFQNLHNLSESSQIDMRFLVQFAKKITAANSSKLRSIVVSHGTFPTDVGIRIGPYTSQDYSPWADMLLRWAKEFLSCLEQNASISTKRLLSIRSHHWINSGASKLIND